MTKAIPTALRLINGNPGKRKPKGVEAAPPAARPSVPEHLSDEAKVEWGRIVDRLFQVGLMTDVDRSMLAAYCDAYAQWVELSRQLAADALRFPKSKGFTIETTNGNIIQNPIIGALRVARGDMVKFALEFGMSPSARSRINIGIGAALAPPAATGTNGKPQESKAAKHF